MMRIKEGMAWAGVAVMVLGGSLGWAQDESPVLVPSDQRSRISVVEPEPKEQAGEPWLGVVVSKASSAVYAQVRDVPRGVGFIVEEVAAAGPAEKAGLQRYDFLWKLDDQLLVNESQFLTLLALHKPGDVVRLTYFRGGENLEAEAILAVRPASETGRTAADLAVVTPVESHLPMRILNVEDRVAILRDDTGAVSIKRTAEGYDWAVVDSEGVETGGGIIAGSADEQIPASIREPLRGKLKALMRSFEQIEARRHIRQARPRVPRAPVPPTTR